jgi:unsaturated rhamnogalacturonyl hydrolase
MSLDYMIKNNIIRFFFLLLTLCVSSGEIHALPADSVMYGAYPASVRPDSVDANIKVVVSRLGSSNIKSGAEEQLFKLLLNDSEVDSSKMLSIFHADEQWRVFCQLEGSTKGNPSKACIDNIIQLAVSKRPCATLAIDRPLANSELKQALMYIHNTAWGINRPIGMLWLDAYRVPIIRSYLAVIKHYDLKSKTSPDVMTDLLFVAASRQFRILMDGMSRPMAFVSSPQYVQDLKTQRALISASRQLSNAQTKLLMKKAAKAQLDNLFNGTASDVHDADRSWFRGAFLLGVISAWNATGDSWYKDLAVELSQKNKWLPGPNAVNDGNDLAISQTYLELCEQGIRGSQYLPTKLVLDSLIKCYNPNKVEWSWCDALFMSPPTWVMMTNITGDNKYLKHMDKLWWQTVNLIFDAHNSLFYRDTTYIKKDDGFQLHERNGSNIFWGRGNGWVIAALCHVLEDMPANFPHRVKYEQMFKNMCNSLLKAQGADGMWRASLCDPSSYPMGETSSSSFNCFAFAWGINHHLLDKAKYLQPALKAWKALCACVNTESGKLEYVQLPGDSPRSPVYKKCNVEYATGGFLMAGSEIIKVSKHKRRFLK